ncbi:MAG: hemolysin family protein [Anaerolineales bacterium]|jgi:CBS domain containing-hemolysin-like protein
MEGTIWLDILGLFAVAVLVLANAFFVAAEFSLVSVRRTRIAELVDSGNAAAVSVQQAINNPDKVIAATQLGITLSSLALGWIGEPALSHLLEPIVILFPVQIQSEVSHSLSAGFAFAIITFMHVVVGELMPKSIALQDPESTSLVVARPTLWTERIFKPAIWALNGTGNALLRFIGIQPAEGHSLVHSVEELRMIVAASMEEGVFLKDEGEILQAMFDFGGLVVRQVMIPRTEMIAVEADINLQEIIDLIIESTFTKFPVYDDDLDNIIGIVHVKDLFNALGSEEVGKRTARDFLREALFVPETISVNMLLRNFRDNRQHIAIVLDEYGGTAGLVTLEDLVEEILGEVSDPFDVVTPEIQPQLDGSFLIDGRARLEDVNEHLGLALSEPNYDTIAGYIMGKLGRVPRLHDEVKGVNVRMRVEKMDGMRVDQISLSFLGGKSGNSFTVSQ